MEKILVIEDDKSIARLQRDYLEINGYEVVIENTGDITRIIPLLDGVSLIILDLMLPNGNGIDICKKIQSLKDIPIIIVSAKNQDMDIVLGLGVGADDYMTKPFSTNELIARVKAQLRRYSKMKNAASSNFEDSNIIIRDFMINEMTKTFSVAGETLELTPKEFDIILLLSRHRGRVFAKEEIYERVWKFDSLGDAFTVTVHVKRIREKIEALSPNTPLIETVWGVGYKII
ncbi:response regulator transcription factor [Fusibacter bizertensis]|jgi:Response regulators consisting of a CheY-like receiver domain and a winged-helix DNA-binding domain|uniref:Stage 0 sporulation protein A homolog n=1 Tax=Fusibacter bizertensis TaxID=1488331 RepID=A0ABT6NBD4_9FIRM|nr:response regulator transcription factor [Fusibacter bizertensis]MDH8677731.1 response regulator transcription factor [Fusibacter bizertensis]